MKKVYPKPSGVFYGWIVTGAVFVELFIGFGTAYSFSAFFQPLQKEFNASRADVSLIFSLAGFLYFSLGSISGPLADKFGPRPFIIFGMTCIFTGLFLASQAQFLWQLYLAYGLSVGIGVGFSYVPALGSVQRWFIRGRGFASGLATAGIGAGTLVMPLLTAAILNAASWRIAYIFLSIIAGLVGTSAALLIISSPQTLGLQPDGVSDGLNEEFLIDKTELRVPVKQKGFSLKEALFSKSFWLLYTASFLTSFGLFIPFVHLTPFARDIGLPENTGLWLIGLIGIGSTVGRFFLGGLADRVGRRTAMAGVLGGMALILLWWLAASSVWSLVIFALFFGVCYGGFVALIPALTTDFFGGKNVSGIIGCLYTSVSLGSLLGPTLAGKAFDLSHTYAVPIVASSLCNIIAAGSILLLDKPDRLI